MAVIQLNPIIEKTYMLGEKDHVVLKFTPLNFWDNIKLASTFAQMKESEPGKKFELIQEALHKLVVGWENVFSNSAVCKFSLEGLDALLATYPEILEDVINDIAELMESIVPGGDLEKN